MHNCNAVRGHGTLHGRGRDYGQTEESKKVISQGKYGAAKAAESCFDTSAGNRPR